MRITRGVLLVVAASVAMILCVVVPAGAAVTVSPVSIDFGEVPVGTTVTAVVTVANTGASPFGPINMFGGAPPTAEFNASQSCQATTLPVAGSCSITYSFTPGATGTFSDSSNFTISDTANQADGTDFQVALRGTGIDPNATTTTTTAPTTTSAAPTPTTSSSPAEDEMPETPSPAPPAVTLAYASLPIGAEQTATVTGFQPGEPITASLRPGDVDLGSQAADGSGVVRIAFTVAEDTDPGLHELVVSGASGQASGTFEVVVAAEILPVSADGANGSGPNWWLVVGLVIAVAGASAVGAYLWATTRAGRRQPSG